jgi:hypothetical protein
MLSGLMPIPAVSSFSRVFGSLTEVIDGSYWPVSAGYSEHRVDHATMEVKRWLDDEFTIDAILGVDPASFALRKLAGIHRFVGYCCLFHVVPMASGFANSPVRLDISKAKIPLK